MVATITPAGCGSRHRRLLAATTFAAGAIAASAVLGLAAGTLGAAVGGVTALAAAGVALLAAAREAGLVRVPLPQVRRQVPERWRWSLPLPAWSAAYGAGLGLGLLTYQPVATLWVALAAAAALADPTPAALCLAAYGAARAAMAVLPGWRDDDGGAACARLAGRSHLVRPANAAGLLVCAALLALAPTAAAGQLPLGSGSQLDPSASGAVLAYTQRSAGVDRVVVRSPRGQPIVVPGARTPSLDGDVLAVREPGGIRLLHWRTGEEVGRVDGAVSTPALDEPWLAFRQHRGRRMRLVVIDLRSGRYDVVASVPDSARLDPPAVSHGRLAWAVTDRRGSRVRLVDLRTHARRTLARSRVARLGYPALARTYVTWTEQRAGGRSELRVRRLSGGRTRSLLRLATLRRSLFTTGLEGRTAYVTRWSTRTGAAHIVRVRF